MKLIFFFIATLLIAHATRAKDDFDNDIDATFSSTTPTNLDANLRKALLRALTELENEDVGSKDASVFFSTSTQVPVAVDRIVEKAPASAISLIANADGSTPAAAAAATTDEVADGDGDEDTTQRPVVIIQKSAGVQHRPIISVLNTPHTNENDNGEALALSASSSFNGLNLNAVTVNDKSFTPGVKSVSITPKYDGLSTTGTTGKPPTTTTPENEAKVEDVQFFSAPLVAAFTVHQDARGLPNKVEPIFKQPGHNAISAAEIVDKEREELLRAEAAKRDEYRRQLELQAKQKALEQQVLNLQEQQKKQQEYLLRQQRIIQEQQLQHQRLLEQHRLQHNDRPFSPITTEKPPVFFTTPSPSSSPSFTSFSAAAVSSTVHPSPPSFFQELPRTTPNPLFNQNVPQRFHSHFGQNHFNAANQVQGKFGSAFTNPNTVVSLQSSVSLSPQDLPLNAQILPIRNAVDFHQSPPSLVNSQISNHIDLRPPTPPLSQQQQFFPAAPFQPFQVNNFAPNSVRQGTRVFRQEAFTGNFGLNPSSPSSPSQSTFSIQQSLEPPPPNRFFRSNGGGLDAVPHHNVNQQLNSLLYHSGITRNVRQNDDLQIVSKILAYNVGRENLFSASQRA